MEELATRLEMHGHQTLVPSRGTELQFVSIAEQATAQETNALFVADHFNKIREADLPLIANFKKNGIDGYVGSSAPMQAAMAYTLRKPISVLHKPSITEIASDLSSTGAIKLNGNLEPLA